MEGIHFYVQPNELLPIIERIEYHCANMEVVKASNTFDDPLGLPPSHIEHPILSYKVKNSLLEFIVRNPFSPTQSDDAFVKVLEWSAYTLRQTVLNSETSRKKIKEIPSKYKYGSTYAIDGQLLLDSLTMYLRIVYQNPTLRDKLLKRKSFGKSLVFFYPFNSYLQMRDLHLRYLNAVLLTLFARMMKVPSILEAIAGDANEQSIKICGVHVLPSILQHLPHPKQLIENSDGLAVPNEASIWAENVLATFLHDVFCSLDPVRFIEDLVFSSSQTDFVGDLAKKELMVIKTFESTFQLENVPNFELDDDIIAKHNAREENSVYLPKRESGG